MMIPDGVSATPSACAIALSSSITRRYNHLMHIHQQDGPFERFLRMNCPRCEKHVTEEEAFVVTSCFGESPEYPASWMGALHEVQTRVTVSVFSSWSVSV
jgi:hypothetical protein